MSVAQGKLPHPITFPIPQKCAKQESSLTWGSSREGGKEFLETLGIIWDGWHQLRGREGESMGVHHLASVGSHGPQ